MPTHDIRSGNIHLELAQETGLKEIEEVLNRAGIHVQQTRTVTPIHNGYSMTDLLITGIWDHETGYEQCRGKCNQHRSWDSLNPEQKRSFTDRYTQFIENCQEADFQPEVLITGDDQFENVRLTKH